MNTNNYGFVFNNIEVKNEKLTKSAKNEYGKNKILKEISFYDYIISNKINLAIPKIYLLDRNNGIIEMEYLKHCVTSTSIFYDIDVDIITNKILEKINILHSFSIITISKEIYLKNIKIEVNDKVLSRYNETKWDELPNFKRIKTINNRTFKNVE